MKIKSLLAVALVFSGCSLTPYDLTSVKLTLSLAEHSSNRTADIDILSFPNYAPPILSSNFTCYGVNVVGPGIDPSGNFNGNVIEKYNGLLGGSSCSYPGITTNPLPPGGQKVLSLTVPSGPGRIIQAIGIDDPNNEICGQNIPLGQTHNTVFAHAYELGRVFTDLFNDKNVNVPNGYNSLGLGGRRSKMVDCDDVGSVPQNGLRAWFKAEYFVGQVANSANVTINWPDATNQIASLSAISNPVFFETGGPNNRPYVRFANGTNSNFHNSTAGFGSSINGLTVFLVASISSTGTAVEFLKIDGASGSDNYLIKLAPPQYKSGVQKSGTPIAMNIAGATSTGWVILSALWDSPTGDHKAFQLGAGSQTVGTAHTGQNLDLNQYFIIGDTTASPAVDRDVAEVLVYNQVLSAKDRERVHTYLMRKYNLP